MLERDLDDVLADLQHGLKQLAQAKPEYAIADSYYTGHDLEVFVSDALRTYLRDQVSAYRLNLASVAVDVTVDRLYISAFTSPDAGVQKEIDRIIEENDVWMWLHDAMREAEKLGDNYISVWEGIDGRPVLSAVDPLTARVIYDEDLERVPAYMVRAWPVGGDADHDQQWRATIYYADLIYKFESQSGGHEEAQWLPYEVEGEAWPLPNPLGEPPTAHFRNEQPYGSPGHARSYGMQQVITKAILNMMANVDYMGFRQRYLLKHPDQASSLPQPSPRTRDGELVAATETTRSGLTAGPGKLWNLFGAVVGEFQPTDVDQFIKLLDWAAQSMARAERLPQRMYFDSSGQQPSGESQRENDKALRDRINSRKRSYGAAAEHMMSLALAMAGRPNAEVNVEWARDEIVTEQSWFTSAAAAADLIQRAIGNPALEPFIRHKLAEAGYSEDEIDEFFAARELAPLPPPQAEVQGEPDTPDEVEEGRDGDQQAE